MIVAEHAYYRFEWDGEGKILSFIWLPATAGMNDEDFKAALSAYAGQGEQQGARGMLVDVSEFRHQPGDGIGPWRDQEITPRYNATGVGRFAYVLGEGKPLPPTGNDGQPAAPGEQFLTRFFNTRADARSWLAGE